MYWKPVLITLTLTPPPHCLDTSRASRALARWGPVSGPFDRQIYGAEQITHVEPIVSHRKSQIKISN